MLKTAKISGSHMKNIILRSSPLRCKYNHSPLFCTCTDLININYYIKIRSDDNLNSGILEYKSECSTENIMQHFYPISLESINKNSNTTC